jgi:hypothetical protein
MKIINIISYINANFGENKNLKYAINDSTNKNNFKFKRLLIITIIIFFFINIYNIAKK